MKVLQILPELNVGGVETGTLDMAKYLVAHGHDAVVVSNGGALVPSLEALGARHYTLAVHLKSLWGLRERIQALRKIIVDERVDIVHARSRVPAWIAYFASQRTQARFLTTCHGYYRNPWFSRVMGFAPLVIVPSRIIGKHMIETFKVAPDHIRYIPRSVDLERFQRRQPIFEKKLYTIAMIGRMTPLKGHLYFFRAMAELLKRRDDVQIIVIGDAPARKPEYRQELEAEVQQLGLSERVTFYGNRQDIATLLLEVDVLVMASIYPESFGRVIVEAQAAGVPVVATRVGGVVDIIDDQQTGLLVSPRDVPGMAQAVHRLLKNHRLANQLVEQAYVKLKKDFTLAVMARRTLEVYNELLAQENILVIKLSSLGDVVLITAALKVLRKRFARARITCLVGKPFQKILKHCPYVDELILFDGQDRDRGWLGVWRLASRLRCYRFDKIIDFQNNRKSHVLAYLSAPQASYGYRRKWGRLLTRTVRNPQEDIPAVAHQFQILNMLGLHFHSDMRLELWPSKADQEYVAQLLKGHWVGQGQHLVGINLGASEKWKSKNWPIEYIAQLCDLLAARNCRVVVTGMDKDRALADQLESLCATKVINAVAQTDMMQLAVLIQQCACFVTPDSAPMHVAAAMKTPCVVFFGPTDSRRHRPPADALEVMEKRLACAPCYHRHCHILTHACLRQIMPEEVMARIEVLMKGPM